MSLLICDWAIAKASKIVQLIVGRLVCFGGMVILTKTVVIRMTIGRMREIM